MSTSYPASYTTVEDIYQTLPQIGSVTNVQSKNIAYQIGRVENMMNAKLSESYTIPFSTVPLQLTTIATDLTVYELSKRFTKLSNLKDDLNASKYKEANDLLDKIVSGSVPLLDSSFQVISKGSLSGGDSWSNTKSFTPTFNEQPFTDQELDTDKDG